MRSTKDNTNSRIIVLAGVLIALAVITASVVVLMMIGTDPTAAVAVLTAFGAILSTIPSIIRALRGDGDARLR